MRGHFPDLHVDSTSDDRTVNNVMRHAYRILTPEEKADMQRIKDVGLELYKYIEGLTEPGANSRELELAKQNLEQAIMWAVKHITR